MKSLIISTSLRYNRIVRKIGLIISLLFTLPAFCQTGDFELRVNGDTVSGEALTKNTAKSQLVAQNIFNDYLAKLYARGYIGASLDSIVRDSVQNTIIAHIYPGLQYSWAQLKPGNADEGMLSKIRFREKLYREEPLNLNKIDRLINRILTYYENNGYPFAALRLDSLTFNNGKARAVLNIDQGERIRIDSVRILSDDDFPETFVFNYIGIKKGDLYNEQRINEIPTRLDELPFASQLKSPEILFTEEKTILTLTLEREKANSIDGILGFQPQEDDEAETILTGEVDARFRNALGAGELIALEWRRLQTNVLTADIQVEFPYIFGTRFGVEADLNLYRLDTSFININQRLGIQYYFKGDRRITGFIQRHTTNLIDTEPFREATTLPENADVRFTAYGLNFQTVNVDYKFNPTRGFDLMIEASTGTKTIRENPNLENIPYDTMELSTSQYSGRLNLNHYLPFTPRLVWNNQLQGGFMFNQNLFRNELFRIGGLHTLRGFDEESIFASTYVIHKTELRFILEKNSFVYAFFNGAWYERALTTEYVRDLPYGFGAGVTFETAAGIFSINYALGKQFDNPIDFSAGKIHFGFANFF